MTHVEQIICVPLYVNSVVISESCSEVYANGGLSVRVQLSAVDTVTVAVDSSPKCAD